MRILIDAISLFARVPCYPWEWKMRATAILLISLFSATTVIADEKSVQKYRNYTPEQIRTLPEKVRQSELPMMYSHAAQRGLSIGSELLFAMELNLLMYPGIHDYQSAVRAFQTDLGDKPTGVLTVWQIHSLGKRSEMQKLARVFFPDTFASFKADNVASIQGTLVLIEEKIAWPVNHVTLTCLKTERTCELAKISLAFPDDNSWSQNYHVMRDETEHYDISRWTQDNIDAEFPERPDSCRTHSLKLNFKTREFHLITRNAGGKCEFLGKTLEKLPKPRIGQIVDGKKIIGTEFSKVETAAYNALASDFRQKVGKLAADEKKRK